MRSPITLALAAVAAAKDTWGPAVSFGPSKSVIVRASTVLTPGTAPTQPRGGFLTIWPGMSNGSWHLVQSTLESHEPGRSRCGEKTGEWCVMASVFGRPWGQKDSQQMAVVKGKQRVRIEYVLGKDNDSWTQRVSDADSKKVLSTLTTKSGPFMRGWGTGVECQRDCHGPFETHWYTDTEIEFKEPEPGFKLGASQGATFTPPKSENGGRLWKVAKMTIPPMRKSP